MTRFLCLAMMVVFPVWLVIVGGVSIFWVIGAITAIVAGLMLLVLVHELGHVLVGAREGLPLRWLAVGPVMIDFTRGRRLRRSPFGGAIGGCAVFDLGHLSDAQVARARCRMSARGPVASLLLAVVCLGLEVGPAGLPPAVTLALQVIGGLSLFVGLANAIPFRLGPLRSDGCTCLTLLRGGESAASLVRAARLTAPAQSPTRPADWPAAVVARMRETLLRLDAPAPALLDEWLTSAYLLYWHLVDRGRIDDAQAVLRRCSLIPRDPKLVKRRRYDLLDLLTALHLALWEGDGAIAARIVVHLPKRSFLRRSTLWTGTEAAVLLARGDFAGALKKARQAQRRLAPFVDLMGVNAVEQRCWASVIQRAEAAIARQQRLAATLAKAMATAGPVPAVAAVAPAISLSAIGHAPAVGPSVRSTLRAPASGPDATRWLRRGQFANASKGFPEKPVPFPLPAIAANSPELAGRRKTVPIPRSSVPVAMLKAIGATVVLVVAMVAVTIAFGMVLIGLLGEENSMTVGRLMWAFAFAIQVAIAVSVWRQAGARWAIPTLFLLVLIFPLYLYKQHRGMAKRTTGEPVRRFRTMATAGSLIATGILLVGLAGGIALYQHVTEPVIEGNRTIHVR